MNGAIDSQHSVLSVSPPIEFSRGEQEGHSRCGLECCPSAILLGPHNADRIRRYNRCASQKAI